MTGATSNLWDHDPVLAEGSLGPEGDDLGDLE
jgi:hypothetical protein